MLTPRSYPFILLLFQFCSNCPVSYSVSNQTPIYLKPHCRTRKVYKKKNHCCVSHPIKSQFRSTRSQCRHQPPSPVASPSHRQLPILLSSATTTTIQPSDGHLLTCSNRRQTISVNPQAPILILVSVAPPKALHLVRHCRTKL